MFKTQLLYTFNSNRLISSTNSNIISSIFKKDKTNKMLMMRINPISRLSNYTRLFSTTTNSSNGNLSSILNDDHKKFIKIEQNLLNQIMKTLKSWNNEIILSEDNQMKYNIKEDLKVLEDLKININDLFLIVVVGEFNAGKSTFINSLLGDSYLQDGVLPTTSRISIIRKLKNKNDISQQLKKPENISLEEVDEISLPISWLENIAIVDTPGTNAIISKHEELTQKFIPRSDLVLFLTSAERPITESEGLFLNKIAQWGRKIIIIVNKMDIITNSRDYNDIMNHVSQSVSSILGLAYQSIPIYGISSRKALMAKLSSKDLTFNEMKYGPQGNVFIESQLGLIEEYLHNHLSHKELIYNKLDNPLKSSDAIITKVLILLYEEIESLTSDLNIMKLMNENINSFEYDLQQILVFYHGKIDILVSQVITNIHNEFDNIPIDLFSFKTSSLPSSSIQETKPIVSTLVFNNLMNDIGIDITGSFITKSQSIYKLCLDYIQLRPKKALTSSKLLPFSNHLITRSNQFQSNTSNQDFLLRLQRDSQAILSSNTLNETLIRLKQHHMSMRLIIRLSQISIALGALSCFSFGFISMTPLSIASCLIPLLGISMYLPFQKKTIK